MKNMQKVAFPGVPGAYSDAAARACCPDAEYLSCSTFEPAFDSVRDGTADLAVIPVENMIAGRVTDVHALLPNCGLHIIGEHFQPIRHHLLGLPGAELKDIRLVMSHIQALSQCSVYLAQHKLPIENHIDTAGAAKDIATRGDKSLAAIASARAGELYGLLSLAADIADHPNNTTRFLILSRDPVVPAATVPSMTSMVFTVKSVPAALYKALGGFATNGINLTKIESYVSDVDFTSASFYIDVEGHVADPSMQLAMDELRHFAHSIKILGTYPQAPWRIASRAAGTAGK